MPKIALAGAALLAPHHVAEILSCTQRHVRNLIRAGELQAHRIGKRNCRVTRASLMIFLEKNKIEPEDIYE